MQRELPNKFGSPVCSADFPNKFGSPVCKRELPNKFGSSGVQRGLPNLFGHFRDRLEHEFDASMFAATIVKTSTTSGFDHFSASPDGLITASPIPTPFNPLRRPAFGVKGATCHKGGFR